jgi:2-oxoglutarate dehydrogenase E2 component (dihydrolipoamide succinyltransferase)
MSIEIKVPTLPESVSSATIAGWHVKAGDTVKREQNLVDLETDKVVLEVPATADGVLKEIRAETGATVNAGDVIGLIIEGSGASAPAKADKPDAAKPAASKAEAAKAPSTSAPAAGNEDQSPAVRKLLSELGLSAADMKRRRRVRPRAPARSSACR